MSNLVVVPDEGAQAEALRTLILGGDMSKLKPAEKTAYYLRVCSSVGLNPYTKPFDYMVFQGREILYANKGCAEQLRSIHGISIDDIRADKIGDLYTVTSIASMKDGRKDSSIGAVNVTNLKAADLANAMMKAETKAKRRVTLSMVGLGNMPDESELEDMKAAEQGKRTNEIHATVIANSSPVAALPLPGDFLITFGRHANKKISELSPGEISESIKYWYNRADVAGKPLDGKIAEMVQAMEAHLGTT